MKAGTKLIVTFAAANAIALAAGGIGLYNLERIRGAETERYRSAAARESRLLRVGLALPGLGAELGNASLAGARMEDAVMAYGRALAADEAASAGSLWEYATLLRAWKAYSAVAGTAGEPSRPEARVAEELRSSLDRLAARNAAESEAQAAASAESARSAYRRAIALLALAALAAAALGLTLARAAARRMEAEEEALQGLKALLEAEGDQGAAPRATRAVTVTASLPNRGLVLMPRGDRGARPRLMGAAGQGGHL